MRDQPCSTYPNSGAQSLREASNPGLTHQSGHLRQRRRLSRARCGIGSCSHCRSCLNESRCVGGDVAQYGKCSRVVRVVLTQMQIISLSKEPRRPFRSSSVRVAQAHKIQKTGLRGTRTPPLHPQAMRTVKTLLPLGFRANKGSGPVLKCGGRRRGSKERLTSLSSWPPLLLFL